MTIDDVRIEAAEDGSALSALLDDEIYSFNAAATGHTDGRRLALRALHGDELAGALTGWTWGGCGYVDVLWIAELWRGQGLGGRLLDLAESDAIAHGCTVMALSSHTFQAPGFYLARGYAEVGRTEGYPRGFAQVHLRKELAGAGE